MNIPGNANRSCVGILLQIYSCNGTTEVGPNYMRVLSSLTQYNTLPLILIRHLYRIRTLYGIIRIV